MVARGAHTLREILGQVSGWHAALEEIEVKKESLHTFLAAGQFSEMIFTGCGSGHYLAQAAAPLFQGRSINCARAVPASELLLFPDAVLPPRNKTLLVTVSRSGKTTETLRAARTFKEKRGPSVVTISCYEDSPLAGESTVALIADAEEQSIVETRSFSSMLVIAQAWACLPAIGEHIQAIVSLPDIGEHLISQYHDLARQLGEDPGFDRFFFLGSGPQYGLACESMLKMKEMSLSYAEAFHFMEFRHGPMSMVNEATLVIGLLSDRARNYEVAVLKEMQALGACTLVLAEDAGEESMPADHLVCFKSGLTEPMRGVLYMPVLQLMAYYRAMRKGLDPDTPEHLSAVVTL